MTSLAPGVAMTTSHLAMSFLRTPTVESQTLIGRGRLLHATHTLGLCEGFVEDAQGHLLAHGTARCVLLPVEAPQRGTPTRPVGTTEGEEPDPYARTVEGAVAGREFWNKASGIERLRDLIPRVHPTPLMQLTGTRIIEVTEGEVTIGMAASRWLTNYGGTIYGGATTFLAEGAATAAVLSTLPSGTACAPLDLMVNFLRAIRPHDGEITAKARIVQKGRTLAMVSCEVRAQGKLAAIANESVLLLPGRAWDEPVHIANEVVRSSDD
jgi:uncharacterized protein (TIGR00369 family)